MGIKVLALDLERTLISDAMSAEPRRALFEFLRFCDARFGRVALFTTVATVDAHEVLEDLARADHVPAAFLARLEVVEWDGEYKDLRFVPGSAQNWNVAWPSNERLTVERRSQALGLIRTAYRPRRAYMPTGKMPRCP